MKITKLTSENVQRVKAITIEPDGNVVVVGGRNAAGKSSALNSIAFALGGKKLCPEVPIRQGQTSARTEVTLDDGLVVTRRFTPSGSTLTVTAPDGARYKSPQQMLDGLIGELSFDPLEFARLKPAEQGDTLRRLVGLDTSVLDRKRQETYDQRTVVNRELKAIEAQLSDMPSHDDVPTKEVSLSDLVKEIERRTAVNSTNQDRIKQLEDERQKAIALKERIEEARIVLQQMEDQCAELQQSGRALAAEVAELVDEDVDGLRAQLQGAEQTNERIRANKQRVALEERARAIRTESQELTEWLQEIDSQRSSLIAKVEYPVPGLRVADTGVMFNGVPFEQASSAEQLRVSVAIGLALNPQLRVMVVRDGSLLDADNLRLIAEMAAEADAQVWIERVSEGDECTVIIEDGEIVGDATNKQSLTDDKDFENRAPF